MSSYKKVYLYREFAAGVYLSEVPPPDNPKHPHPFYTLYTCTLIHTRKGEGGRVNQREG